MTDQTSNIGDQIDRALRMLNAARAEFRSDHGEDAADFLRCAQRRIASAIQGLEATATVIALPRGKEAHHAR